MPADLLTETNISPDRLDDFLSEARDRFEFGRQADVEDRSEAEHDNRFAYADDTNLDQWDEVAKKARRRRPILQWNRLPTSIQQVANDGRENKPSIRTNPEDNTPLETAEYFQSRIRHIEYESNASTAKDTARDQQITTGRGFIRVSTEYIKGTWRQKICIDRIENQFSVVWDPAACKYDRTDADWCFVVSLISRDESLRKYGEDRTVHRLDFADAIKLAPSWVGVGAKGDLIQIAEYWRKEYHKRQLCLFGVEGVTAWKDELTKEQYETLKANGQIRAERTELCASIHQYIINGIEILDHTEWIGSTIPIVPVWGKEAVVDGKRRTFSLIRNAKGPQRLLNLLISNLAEKLAQMAKSPYKIPVGGIPANSENDWKNANTSPLAYLLYNAWDVNGRALPAPDRVDYEPPIQAIIEGIRECIDGIKASMGIYDAALGAKSNETSGIAIERRKKESDVSNYHFPDNEARSNKYLGEILVELIKVLDEDGTENPVRTEDGKTYTVPIGKEHKDWKTGKMVCHDLSQAQVGVTVDTGPSYTSQRQQQFDRDAAIITAQPEMLFVIGDQMFDADDTPGAKERAERMRRYIEMKNPGLIQNKEQEPIPPEVQAKMAQLEKTNMELEGFAKQLHEQIQTEQKKFEHQMEIEKMKLEFQRDKLTVDSEVKLLVEGLGADVAALKLEIDVLNRQNSMEQESRMEQIRMQHEADQGQIARDHEAEQGQVARDHEATQAEAGRIAESEAAAAAQEQPQ